jgi:hypothetical protein
MEPEAAQETVTIAAPAEVGGEESSPPANWSETRARAREFLAARAETPAEVKPATAPEQAATPAAETADKPVAAPAEEPATVPSYRLREETDKRRALETQLQELGAYAPLILDLQKQGLTTTQIAARLVQAEAQQAAEVTPPEPELTREERFESYVRDAGVDPDTASTETLAALAKIFDQSEAFTAQMAEKEARLAEMEGRFEQIDRSTAESEQRAIEKSLEAEMTASVNRFPVLGEPEFQQAIYAQYALEAGSGQEVTLAQVAERFAQGIEKTTRNAIAKYSTEKQGDARVPVATGGGGAAVPAAPGIYDKGVDRQGRRDAVREFLATRGAQAG